MKTKLNKKVKQKWVKALRSGKFKQTQGNLKNQFGFCCLGVACEIGLTTPKNVLNDFNSFVNENFLTRGIQDKLVKFNDGNKSFKWIASYIERYL